MSKVDERVIDRNESVRSALKRLNFISDTYVKDPLGLFVADEDGRCIGTLTDGDIRRNLLTGKDIDDPVVNFMNSNFRYLRHKDFDPDYVRELYEANYKLIPVLDDDNRLVKVIDFTKKKSVLPVDAVLMAGGEGQRLRPLTETIPKPLLKVGNKPIIEHNIDRLNKYGIENIHISVRYLGEQIINYFGDGSQKDIKIDYVTEDEPLGTMGAIKLFERFEHDYILLMNSDLLTTVEYDKFFHEFIKSGADMAVGSVPYEVKVPFAVLHMNGEKIVSCKEKPEYTYYSNAGIYLLKTELLDGLKRGVRLDTTDFIANLIDKGRNVIYYPILGYWMDIGQIEDFNKVQKDIKLLEL